VLSVAQVEHLYVSLGLAYAFLNAWDTAQEALEEMLAYAQMNAGQVQQSIASDRRALALSQESKNAWVQVYSMSNLTYGLLEAGSYEEALGLIQHTLKLERTLPPIVHLRFLLPLGATYQALQQWEEGRAVLEEAEAVAERLEDRGPFRVHALSRLCMHYAVAREWDAASRYALQAIAVRKNCLRAAIREGVKKSVGRYLKFLFEMSHLFLHPDKLNKRLSSFWMIVTNAFSNARRLY
jgi:tetratricopeptide (TPR) repeat protein